VTLDSVDLVLGANGYVGRLLVQHLKASGSYFIASDIGASHADEHKQYLEVDLIDPESVEKLPM